MAVRLIGCLRWIQIVRSPAIREAASVSLSLSLSLSPSFHVRAGFVNARESPEPEHRLAHMFRHGEGGREVLNIRDGGRGEETEVRGGPRCAWDGGSIPSNQTPSYVRLTPRQRIFVPSPSRARSRSCRPPFAPLSILDRTLLRRSAAASFFTNVV